MEKKLATFKISDLLDCKIMTPEGTILGHIADIQITSDPPYMITALIFGLRGWLYRFHTLHLFRHTAFRNSHPKIIPWSYVESVECSLVKLKPGYKVRELELL
jgi:sporulation protein YlmC with PRC-barrel domain